MPRCYSCFKKIEDKKIEKPVEIDGQILEMPFCKGCGENQ